MMKFGRRSGDEIEDVAALADQYENNAANLSSSSTSLSMFLQLTISMAACPRRVRVAQIGLIKAAVDTCDYFIIKLRTAARVTWQKSWSVGVI